MASASAKDNRYIVFICTGNTCRSPMAERLMRHALNKEKNLEELRVISAGVSAYEGSPASPNAIQALKDCNIDLADHKSRPLTQALIDQSIAIFCMTAFHRDILMLDYTIPDNLNVHLIREFTKTGKSEDVPDPIGRGIDAYRTTRDSIVEAIPGIIQHLKESFHP